MRVMVKKKEMGKKEKEAFPLKKEPSPCFWRDNTLSTSSCWSLSCEGEEEKKKGLHVKCFRK